MAQTYNVQIEDSAGNKYCPKPDLLTTKEQLTANNAAGKSVDALVVKMINNDLKFPDGTGFYPDVKDGICGWNTSAARGADTFHPFNNHNHEIDIQTGVGKQSATITFNNIPRKESYLVLSSESFSTVKPDISGDLVSCEEILYHHSGYSMCGIYKIVTSKLNGTISVTKKYNNTYEFTLNGIIF